MRTIAIVAQKGGVGKTSTTQAISAGLTSRGKKVLAIDLDAQCSLSYLMRADAPTASAMDVLTGAATIDQATQQTPTGAIVAGSDALATADLVLTETGREYRLREALEAVTGDYDYCVIDTPPGLGIITINAIAAADGVIIPSQADALSLQAIGKLFRTLQTVKKYCNPALKVYGIVLCRFTARTLINRDAEAKTEAAAAQLQTKVYKARIRECAALKEAQLMRQDIFTYAPKSNAASDLAALINEIEMEE